MKTAVFVAGRPPEGAPPISHEDRRKHSPASWQRSIGGTIGDDDVDVTRATFRGVNTKIIFFCFFYFLHQSQQQTQQRQAGHKVFRLEGTALRDSDSCLGGAGRGAEGLNLLDEVHAVDNLACIGGYQAPVNRTR